MMTLRACPLCDSRDIVEYPQFGLAPQVDHDIMPGVSVPAAIITHYMQCRSCHVLFQNPRMTDKELDRFYADGYYRQTVNLTDAQKDTDERHRATVDATLIKAQVGDITSHLDIGCSRGYLLELMGAGRKVGVETDVVGVTARDVTVYKDMDAVGRKQFDLVTAVHVLEHVSDPVSFLKKMVTLVAPNGHVGIEVPTWKSPGGPLRLPHVFHFEPDVLRLLVRRVGLRVRETHFTPHFLLLCTLERQKMYNTL